MLRLIDVATSQPIAIPTEQRFLLDRERRRADALQAEKEQERQRADALQAEVERLLALLGGGSANVPETVGDGEKAP